MIIPANDLEKTFLKNRLAPQGVFLIFYYPFCGLGLENLVQGTDRLPAREGRATVATAAFGFASDESLGTYHLKGAIEGYCLHAVSPPSCILKGIPKHLIRCIGGGVYFPHRFRNLVGRRVPTPPQRESDL